MDIEKITADAVALFNNGYNCAESVATAVTASFVPGQNCLPKLATCFGGGLGRRGETCGALVGALLAASLLKGREPGEGDDAKKRAYECSERIVEQFREDFGCLNCRGLLGVDLSDPAGFKTYKERDMHHTHCVGIVAAAVRTACEALSD